MLKTYVITVEGSDRGQWMQDQLRPLAGSLDVEFLVQTPGTDIDLVKLAIDGVIKLFPMHRISGKLFDQSRMEYKKGTLGCMLGHYSAYCAIAASDAPYALILEDNLEFSSSFEATLSEAMSDLSGESFDILHLHSTHQKERQHFRGSLFHGEGEWGAAKAQIVSKRFAQFVVSNIPLHEVADGITMLPSLNWVPLGMKSLVLYPHPVSLKQGFKSTRLGLDGQASACEMVYRQAPGSTGSYFVGFKGADGNVTFDYEGKMYLLSFGVAKARKSSGKYELSGFTTANEVFGTRIHNIMKHTTIEKFCRDGQPVVVEANNGTYMLTRSNLMVQAENDETMFMYIRENTVPAMRSQGFHHFTTPAYSYITIGSFL